MNNRESMVKTIQHYMAISASNEEVYARAEIKFGNEGVAYLESIKYPREDWDDCEAYEMWEEVQL